MSWPRLTDASWVSETAKRLEIQNAYRDRIEKSTPLDEDKLRSLDSALKKTTAFMKKVKTLSAATVPSTIADVSKLNLSKFVEEIAQAIAETKMKAADIAPVVDFCVEIALRYGSFSEVLLSELKKNLPLKKTDKISNPAKLRIDFRFLCELVVCGVLGKDGLQCIGAVVTYLTSTDKTEFVHVGLICSLARPIGWQIAGIVPHVDPHQTDVQLEPISTDTLSPGSISAAHKKIMNDMLLDYRSHLVEKTDKACSAMNAAQKKVKRQERTRGDASAEDKAVLDTARTEFERLKSLATDLSLALGVQLKSFTEEPSDDEEDELAAAEMDKALMEGQVVLWPDDETKAFYVNILNIRDIVPKTLYRESEQKTVETSQMETSVEAVDLEGIETEQQETGQEPPQPDREQTASPTLDAELIQEILAPLTEDMKIHMQKFVQTMDHLVNREVTDQAALDFVSHLNTKGNRKRLVKMLAGCPYSRMDLVPFYARLVATLNPVMPDVSAEVVNILIQSFRTFIQRSNAEDRVESKLICVMYIGELVKFGVIPRAEALSCLRQMVYDFRWHFIDMACIMLETSGYYLYRNTDSHPKMKTILDVIMKKRERVKDVRHVMLIDNAFYACMPPENGPMRKVNEEPALNQFIKKMVQNVTEDTVDKRIKMLRRLDWLNEEVSNFCLRCLASPWLVPYSNLPALASTIAGLKNLSHHDWIGAWVVDALTETIRIALEIPGVYNQQAIACVTLLGELYNYSVCDSAVIYKILYQLISFPEYDVESWQDFYRVRMICELLNTIGEFFQTGKAAMKMDYFLAYFRRYFWFKKQQWLLNMEAECGEPFVFPADVEVEYGNSMKKIRKSAKLPKSLDECESVVAEIEKELKANIDVPMDDNEEEEEVRHVPDRHLTLIREEEDEGAEDENDSSDLPKGYSPVVCGYDDNEEEEKVRVHMEVPEKTVDDDEFEREYERMMAEAFRTVSTASGPSMDMTVPSNIRQKFNRTITFADQPEQPSTSSASAEVAETPKQSNKVALMTRGRGNKAVLKTVVMEDTKLHENWQKEKEREERERAIMKRVTLGHTARMEAEEEQEKKTSATTGPKKFSKYR